MSRIARLVLAALAMVVGVGCPFESTVPLGDPEPGSLDPRLLGLWTWIDPDGGAVSQLQVRRFNDAEYLVDYQSFGAGREDPERESYRVFRVLVGGQEFFNIQPLEGEDDAPGYTFARAALSECGVLELRFVGEQAVPEALATDRQGLLEFVARNADGDTLHAGERPMRFHRAGSS